MSRLIEETLAADRADRGEPSENEDDADDDEPDDDDRPSRRDPHYHRGRSPIAMATQSKAQHLADIQGLLKKRYKPSPAPPKLTVFESVVYGICHEDATRTQADAAMEAFRTGFFDWNEVRVSPITEIQGVFEKLRIPDAEERAGRLRRFLRQLFEKFYGFNLEPLLKKPLKDATKSLQEFEALHSRLRPGDRDPARPRRPRHRHRPADPAGARAARRRRAEAGRPHAPRRCSSAPSRRTGGTSSST